MVELEKDFLGDETTFNEDVEIFSEEPREKSFFTEGENDDIVVEELFIEEIPTIDEVRNVNKVHQVPAYRRGSWKMMFFSGSLALSLAFLGGSNVDGNSIVEKEIFRNEKENAGLALSAVEEKNDKEFVINQTEVYGSGLFEEGNYTEEEKDLKFRKEGVLAEELKATPIWENKYQLGDFVDVEVANCLDLTNWENYELISTEDLEPTNFLPRIVSYLYYDEEGQSGVLSPRLYIMPVNKSTAIFDTDLPILEYSLVPDMFHSLEVSKIYTISTPEGGEIVFGGPKGSNRNDFNGKFVVLMWVTTPGGERIDFMLPEDSPEETKLLIQSLSRHRERINLDFSFYPEKVILAPDLETRDFQELLNYYNPELLPFAKKHNPTEIKHFLEIFWR